MYVLYIRYVRSSYILRSLYSILCNLSYYSSLYSLIGSILDRALINQLASFNSSLSSRNIVLKASVILITSYKLSVILVSPPNPKVVATINSIITAAFSSILFNFFYYNYSSDYITTPGRSTIVDALIG